MKAQKITVDEVLSRVESPCTLIKRQSNGALLEHRFNPSLRAAFINVRPDVVGCCVFDSRPNESTFCLDSTSLFSSVVPFKSYILMQHERKIQKIPTGFGSLYASASRKQIRQTYFGPAAGESASFIWFLVGRTFYQSLTKTSELPFHSKRRVKFLCKYFAEKQSTCMYMLSNKTAKEMTAVAYELTVDSINALDELALPLSLVFAIQFEFVLKRFFPDIELYPVTD